MSTNYVDIENDAGVVERYRHHANGRGFVSAHATVHRTAYIARGSYVDPGAEVHAEAHIGPDSWVEPGAIVGAGALLGSRVHVRENAVVGRGVRLGNRVVVGVGARVGAGARLGDDETIPDAGVVPAARPTSASAKRTEYLGLAA